MSPFNLKQIGGEPLSCQGPLFSLSRLNEPKLDAYFSEAVYIQKHLSISLPAWDYNFLKNGNDTKAKYWHQASPNLGRVFRSIVDSIFYFPDRESIVTEQKIDFEVLTDLYVLRSQESEKVDYKKCPSVCLSSVEVIVRTLLSRSIWNSGCGLRMWISPAVFSIFSLSW